MTDSGKQTKKIKYNASFTPEDRVTIGRYATENGNAATVKKFKTSVIMLERALCDFSRSAGYQEEIKKSESGSVECIPKRKTGRRVMLGEKLNDELK